MDILRKSVKYWYFKIQKMGHTKMVSKIETGNSIGLPLHADDRDKKLSV